MNPELLNLLLLAGLVLVSCLAVYTLFKVIDSRPDIAALFSGLAIASGLVGLAMPDFMSPVSSLLVTITGCFFLLFSGFTYNRNRG